MANSLNLATLEAITRNLENKTDNDEMLLTLVGYLRKVVDNRRVELDNYYGMSTSEVEWAEDYLQDVSNEMHRLEGIPGHF
jgi:hypothetical protein